jgi:pilus assembly protein CpaF
MYDSDSEVPNNNNFFPLPPKTVEETQLDFGFLADLALKTVFADANCTTARAAEKLCLSVSIVESLLQYLYQEKLVEIRGQVSYLNNRYAMLERGWQRANRLLDLNGYIGPAPVSLQSYTKMVWQQNQAQESISTESVKDALSDLVLPETIVQTLVLVANSRRSLFMFGGTGNGKTSIAVALHSAQPGEIWIPYAIEVDNQILKVFDLHNHLQVKTEETNGYDKRWIKIKRPLVIVGGEMTIESMDLVYSPMARYYEAPFQVKANGGTLVIDDFGRQRVDPQDLLNRWIIPLERGTDYLTLHTGKKIEVPFNQLLIFATNLNVDSLVDEAFLRRMGYRLFIAPPTRERYGAIFQRVLEDQGYDYDPNLLEFLFERYEKENRPMRCCEPRDLINRLLDIRRQMDHPPGLSRELLELAWVNYFGEAGKALETNLENLPVGDSSRREPAESNRASLQQIRRKEEKTSGDGVRPVPEPTKALEVQKGPMGFGPLETLMGDPSVTDILIDNFDKIYVERRGKLEPTKLTFGSEADLRALIDAILSNVGRRVDESWPMADARLPDGSRINVIIPPLAIDGPSMSIRRFRKDALQLEDLIALKALTPEIGDLLKGIVQARLNVLISGGTGSGKTTLLNVLSSFIPSDERVVSIEDSAELQLNHRYLVRLETRPADPDGKGEIVQRDLVKNALRMRPDRIVVGEVRGAEVLDMLQAMNTGHDGSLSTIHANSSRDALARLETLIATSGLAIPHEAVRKQISSAIDIIVQVARLGDGSRKLISLQEITGMEGNMVTMQELFAFEQTGVTAQGLVKGLFRPKGIRPKFSEKFTALGLEFPRKAFDPHHIVEI